MPRTNGTIDLAQRIDWTQDRQLKDLPYTYETAKKEFPLWVGYCEFMGWTSVEVMSLYKMVCVANQAFFENWGYFTELQPNYSDLRSRGEVLFPDGGYRLNYPILFGYGSYRGKGSNLYYVPHGKANPGTTPGTGLYIDHDTWLSARAPERFCMKACSFGQNAGTSYMQGTTISHIYFNGGYADKTLNVAFVSSSIAMWDAGEASSVHHCYADGFNGNGFSFYKGTPNFGYALSAFSNCGGGVAILGNNGLSTSTFLDISGDDNRELILVDSMGPGNTGGGTVVINGVKHENGKRQPFRQMKMCTLRGALNVVINGISADTQNDPNADILMDVDFQTFAGQVEVHGIRQNGYKTALRYTTNGKSRSFLPPGNIVPWSFTVQEGGIVNTTRTMTEVGGSSPTPTPTPPPSGSTAAPKDFGALTNANPGMKVPLNVTNVKKATVEGLKWNSAGANSYPYILGLQTASGQEAGVQLLPNGTVVPYGSVQLTASPAKLVKGSATAVTLVLTFTQPVTVQYLGNREGSNDAFLGTWTALKLK